MRLSSQGTTNRISRHHFAATALGAIAILPATARAAQFEFKCGSPLPNGHPQVVRGTQMWNAVEKESNGRIRVRFFPNSVLGSDQAQFTQLRAGALEFFFLSTSTAQNVVPPADIAELGFAFRSEPEALRVMDGTLGDYIRKEFAAKNIVAMRKAWNSGMRQTTSSVKPIHTADDMTGFRIRTAEAKMAVDLFKTLGASPTPMPIVELYTALQTHVVDGQDTPLVTIAASRFYEVQKYLSLLNDSWSCHYLVANIDSWKSLPPDLQAIVERNAEKYADLERRDTILMNGSIGDKLIRQGLATNKVDPTSFRARLSPYYKTWSAAFGATQWHLLEDAIGSKLA